MDDNINDSYDELKKTLESLGSPIDKILTAIGDMYDGADKLNGAFVQGRTRLDEMADSVSKAAAGVIRLGGDISDVNNTIIGIASASRRNVIATEEQVSKLYAASTILGTTSKELVENFAEVGYETSQIGVNLESSIEYIQSVGLNAKEVMGDVQNNMSIMNKFNFTDGVVGLSKMAAQASMLRFDMSATAGFAEKVLTPEGAINTAAALQRLGVAVGQLGDPFALMNDAINDPGALQDSLIKATKQFTQFDEKTKSFKINPQGMLTLREMATETGISYDQLTKSALAAADLDKRLSAISPSLDFETEEDKQFLANMATMSKDGDYVVKLKNDETGIIETKKLGEITQGEMEKLREQQENAPKTLEDIQKSQLNVLENIQRTLEGNVAKATFGVAGSAVVRGNLTGAERISRAVASSVDDAVPESSIITDKVNNSIEKMSALFLAKDSKKISSEDFAKQLESLENTILKDASSLGEKGLEVFKDIIRESSQKVTGNSGIEKEFRNFTKEILNATANPVSASEVLKTKTQSKTISYADVIGQRTENPTKSTNAKTNSGDSTTKSKVEFGDFKITIDTPPGTTLSQKQLNDIFNNEKFKQYIANLTKQGSGSGVVSYVG
jgi:hypothetical protein